MKRVNGSVDIYYPKTATDNIVRETKNGEKNLDDILDEKGGFIQYTEQVADESTGNDLLFEVLGDVVDSGVIKSIKGTVVGETPPEDTQYVWVDKSSDISLMKVYDESLGDWKVVDIGADTVELDADIEE